MDIERLKKYSFHLLVFVLQLIFTSINFMGEIFPVGFSFAISRIYFENNIYLVLFSFIVSKFILSLSNEMLFCLVYEVVILILYYFAKNNFNIIRPKVHCLWFVFFSSLMQLYFSFSNKLLLEYFLIELLLKIIFALYFVILISNLKKKFIFFKFSKQDYLLSGIFVFLIGYGLFKFGFVSEYLSYFLLSVALIFGGKLLVADKFFIIIITFMLAQISTLTNTNLNLFLCVCSLLMLSIKEFNKYLYSLISSIILFGFVFLTEPYNYLFYFEIIIAELLFLCFPSSFYEKMSSLFNSDSSNMLVMKIQNKKIDEIRTKLRVMSETLFLINSKIKFLLIGKINHKQASEELSQDIISSNCNGCENYKVCYLQNINKRQIISELLCQAIDYGNLTEKNITNGFQSYCNKSNIMISAINEMSNKFHEFESEVKNEDTSKLLLSDEISNFSDIFSNLSKIIQTKFNVNTAKSIKIRELLTNNLIDVKEVMVIENKNGIESVNLIISNEHLIKREVLSAIYHVIQVYVKLDSFEHIEFSGLSLARFVPEWKIKPSFAVSSTSKEIKNGDSVIVSKISNSKFFIAICDGMGHGEKANQTSSMVLSLIKSMFEIGFDENLIIQSINKLLIPIGIDSFTTLDACILDIEKESATFVKLGSSVSVIKHNNTVEVIKCESLPIGIVKNIRPTITKRQITSEDMIFLASDGIVDSFSSINAYANFINDSKIYNMQKYTDDVVRDIKFQAKTHIDDMTIIAIKLLKNF